MAEKDYGKFQTKTYQEVQFKAERLERIRKVKKHLRRQRALLANAREKKDYGNG